jgi:hypothetical protein
MSSCNDDVLRRQPDNFLEGLCSAAQTADKSGSIARSTRGRNNFG